MAVAADPRLRPDIGRKEEHQGKSKHHAANGRGQGEPAVYPVFFCHRPLAPPFFSFFSIKSNNYANI
jgi:hypothetical protein